MVFFRKMLNSKIISELVFKFSHHHKTAFYDMKFGISGTDELILNYEEEGKALKTLFSVRVLRQQQLQFLIRREVS